MNRVDLGQIGSADSIRAAALDAFYEFGYHGTSVREIAKRTGLSVAALYHHFQSKQQMLVELIHRYMDDLIDEIECAVADALGPPPEQLAAAVSAHVLFHTRRQKEGFVANAELRNLNPVDGEAIREKRNLEQRLFDKIILRGGESGVFCTRHPIEASRGLVTMATAVLSWYREGEGHSAEEIAAIYVDLALDLVGHVPAAGGGPAGKETS